MKSIIRKFLSLSLAVVLAAAPLNAFASDALGDDLTSSNVEVNERTELNAGTFWSNTYSDLRQENYVVYEPNRSVKPIVTSGDYSTQLTTVSSAARTLEADGWRVVAGVNGDYYDTANGIALGSVMSDGVFHNISGSYYALGFYDDGSAVMGKPDLRISAETDYDSFSISAMNYIRQTSFGIFMYDDSFNARGTIGTSEPGYDVICSVRRGELSIGGEMTLEVEDIVEGSVDTAVGRGQYVLSANLNSGENYLNALRALRVGDRITVSVDANSSEWDGVTNLIGALYQLVENGRVCSGLSAGNAPRTAVGLRRDGSLVMYTIDGRQSGYSVGATLTQVAERMIELGCETALSLDGGGSTAMVATNPDSTTASLVSKPSGGSERAVTNHLFLVADSRPTNSVGHVYLESESSRVLPNAQVKLTATALDTNYIPMANSNVSLRADKGTIDGNVLTAPASGTVTVTARAGGASTELEIEVVTQPDSISVQQNGKAVSAITLSAGDKAELSAAAMYRHLPVLGDHRGFVWTVQGNVGTIEDGVFTASGNVGSGSVTASLGRISVTVPVTVTARALRTLDGFETSFATATGTRAMLARSTDMTRVHNGYASARLDYATGSEGNAYIGLNYAIPSSYDQLNFWVYGDNSGNLLSIQSTAPSSDGTTTVTSTTAAVNLNFTGWQQVSVELPKGTTAITGLEIAGTGSGAVYLDQMVLSYGTIIDSAAPSITASLSGTALTATVSDAVDGVPGKAQVTVTYDGKALSFNYDTASGKLPATVPAADGAGHRLTITAVDASGNRARKSIDIAAAADHTSAFTDTQGYWAQTYVDFLYTSGITTGYTDGTFRPTQNISRQEFAVMLYRYLGLDGSQYANVTLPFADSAKIGDFAQTAIKALYTEGIINGTKGSDGKLYFNPYSAISRAQAAAMIGRTQPKGYAAPALTFTDAASIPSYASFYISTLSAQGVISGYTDGSFKPNDSISRGQMAKILYNLM